MKKMITMAILFATITINAQTAKFGIKGGVNLSNMSTKFENSSKFVEDNRKFLLGYHIGLTAGIDFHENFGFEGGLIFNTKGLKYDRISGKYNLQTKKNMYYLNVPVSLKGMYNVGGVQVYGKFGPYVGVGLAGTSTTKLLQDGKEIGESFKTIAESLSNDLRKALGMKGETKIGESDIKWGEEIDKTKRFDYGLQMGIGTEIGGFVIEGIYQFSLGDIDNSDLTNTKHHVLSLSVGYNLGF